MNNASFSIVEVNDFAELFAGRTTAYGQYTIRGYKPGQAENVKIGGDARTVDAPLTEDLYNKHLNGGATGLGIIPIKENNMCRFAVLDVDIYSPVIRKPILDMIAELNAPLCPFLSKSGGLHLYIFFEEDVPAAFAIKAMKIFRDLLGLDKDTEVFPKQSKVEPGQFGNWINLPYYNAGPGCLRTMLSLDDTRIYDLATAIKRAKESRTTKEKLEAFYNDLPLQDAPPCLQRIYLTGYSKSRNNYLFSLAHYYKTKFGIDDFTPHVYEANMRLKDPLPLNEVTTTVIKSTKERDYGYGCSKEPLCNYCDKRVCTKRTYGIGSKEISSLKFGEFRQIMTDPPTYEWVVDDKILKLSSEDEIINQNAFRKQCIRKLHVMPNKLNEAAWADIVNRALVNVAVVAVDVEDDVSPGAIINKYILEYLVKRSVTKNPQSMSRGLVYQDTVDGVDYYLFLSTALFDYLTGPKDLRAANVADLKDRVMCDLQGRVIQYKVNDIITLRVWGIPKSVVDPFVKKPDIDEKTEFLNDITEVRTS